jgi:ribulose-phosphate 3-epimerase
MPSICPSILAKDKSEYEQQIQKVASFAQRIQIDLTDGEFAPSHTISPEEAWWPAGIAADFHLMYKNPYTILGAVLANKPHTVIIHAEAEGNFGDFVNACRQAEAKVGVALLAQTQPDVLVPALDYIDHILIFSGDLGHYGGHANLGLLEKVKFLKQHKPNLEIGWDGGVNTQNAAQLVFGGVDVLVVGGTIQHAPDPAKAYEGLQRIADETGTT